MTSATNIPADVVRQIAEALGLAESDPQVAAQVQSDPQGFLQECGLGDVTGAQLRQVANNYGSSGHTVQQSGGVQSGGAASYPPPHPDPHEDAAQMFQYMVTNNYSIINDQDTTIYGDNYGDIDNDANTVIGDGNQVGEGSTFGDNNSGNAGTLVTGDDNAVGDESVALGGGFVGGNLNTGDKAQVGDGSAFGDRNVIGDENEVAMDHGNTGVQGDGNRVVDDGSVGTFGAGSPAVGGNIDASSGGAVGLGSGATTGGTHTEDSFDTEGSFNQDNDQDNDVTYDNDTTGSYNQDNDTTSATTNTTTNAGNVDAGLF